MKARQRTLRRSLGLVLVLSFFGSSISWSADEDREVKKIVKYRKVTDLDFEDSLIKGKLMRPDGDLLRGRLESRDGVWLQLRSTFRERTKRAARSLP